MQCSAVVVTRGHDAIERVSFFFLFPSATFEDDDPNPVLTQFRCQQQSRYSGSNDEDTGCQNGRAMVNGKVDNHISIATCARSRRWPILVVDTITTPFGRLLSADRSRSTAISASIPLSK